MNCNCIETINQRLKEQNLELDTSLMGRLTIGTRWLKPKRGEKPTRIAVTNCPFCGKKAEKK